MLDKLIQVMPPPTKPLEVGGSEDWPSIEEALGTALPQDYKDFINEYGSGYLGEFVWIFNPFSSSQHINLLATVSRHLPMLRSLVNQARGSASEERHPYVIWPEENGLLPWGKTDNGDELFWQTTGHPDQWTIVAVENRGPDIDRYEGSMTGFLAGIISGEVKSKVVPKSYIDRDVDGHALFEPYIPG
jgi:hypothetical protein